MTNIPNEVHRDLGGHVGRTGNLPITSNPPQIYESQKLLAIFRPLAEITLQHTDISDGPQIINLGCGIGVIGRIATEKAGESGSVMGVDLNTGMIEMASPYPSGSGTAMELHQRDVTTLPFLDTSFYLAFCQQGLQFFPTKATALKEV